MIGNPDHFDLHFEEEELHDDHVDLHLDDLHNDLGDVDDDHDGLDDLHDDHQIIFVPSFLLLHRTLSIFKHLFPEKWRKKLMIC